jgi:hypothetical protein
MKTRLTVFAICAAVLGANNAAVARGNKGQRYEQPGVEHT